MTEHEMTGSDLHDDAIPSNGAAILGRLAGLGFVEIDRDADGHHVLMRRDRQEFTLPGPDREVPTSVVHMIEHALEPQLGPGWLTSTAAPSEERDTDGVVLLEVGVLAPIGDEPWRAFLHDDLATIGFGPDRTAALRDLKAAAALRLRRPVSTIALLTPDVV